MNSFEFHQTPKTPDHFLHEGKLTKLTDALRDKSKELQGNTPQETILRVIEFIQRKINFQNLEKEDHEQWKRVFRSRSAQEILESMTTYGCSDTTIVFVTLLRSAGIPATFVTGKRLDPNGGYRSGGHAWSRVWMDDKWQEVDPSGSGMGFDHEKASHGPYAILSESLDPSDSAMNSYEAWIEVEKAWKKKITNKLKLEDADGARREPGEGKKLLHELEASNRYVFHGSPIPNIQELKLSQSENLSSGRLEKHGPPSVTASPYADIAIFRALVNQDATQFGSDEEGHLNFGASQKALDIAKLSVGYVYVLEREDFTTFGGSEKSMGWRAIKPQKPVRIVRVVFDDLPKDIQRIA